MTTVGFIGSGNIGGTVARLAGKAVLHTINYIPQRDGPIPGLSDSSLSSSEVLQQHLGTAHVVKVFNNITFWHQASLGRPAGAADPSAQPIAGDDPAVKAAVTSFLDAIGYDTVDAGTLGTGGRPFQFGTLALVAPYGPFSDQRVPRPARPQYGPPSAPDGSQRRRRPRSGARRHGTWLHSHGG
jgi:predicted dinucleotide-binding enzyme